MMKAMTAFVAAMAVVCARAEATVYTFNPTSVDASSMFNTIDAGTFTIGISDAAVESGTFTYDFRSRFDSTVNPPRGAFVASATGDVQSLLSFSAKFGAVTFGPGGGPSGTTSDFFSTSLQFDQAGHIVAGSLMFSDDRFFIDISGAGGVFSGEFATGSTTPSKFAGSFSGMLLTATEVPEPSTLGLLAAGLILLARRRSS